MNATKQFPDLRFTLRYVIRKMPLMPFLIFLITLLVPVFAARAQNFSRGIGVYPGDPREDFSPRMRIDGTIYRNLALHRSVYQSSAYDFNLTGQLITDGIVDTRLPGWIVTTTSGGGTLPKDERDWVLDRQPMSREQIGSSNAWIQIEMAGGYEPPEVDSIDLMGSLLVDSLAPQGWKITVMGSNDGTRWDTLGDAHSGSLPGDTLTGFFRRFMPVNFRFFSYPFKPGRTINYRYYRSEFRSPNVESWSVGEFGLYHDGKRAPVGGPYSFTSAWKSAGDGTEWLYIDLGAECSFDLVRMFWIRRASEYALQVSDDASEWKGVAAISGKSGDTDVVRLGRKVKGRYVRVLMTKPATDDGYILSEMEIFGTGGPVPVPHPQDTPDNNNELSLSGGDWRLQRGSLVSAGGEEISEKDFDDDGWMVATVPATELVSYVNDGAVPEPNYSNNQELISDSYFYSDFWYRDRFVAPVSYSGKRTYLNFNGINWKAVVFLNGRRLGTIEGAFTRAKFDVTGILLPGRENYLAVRIIKNDTPGFPTEQSRYNTDQNGGELGADNPTFHASVGWDWIPTIRGRNTGIWNTVYLSGSGPVTIEDPFVSSSFPVSLPSGCPDTTTADVKIEVTLINKTDNLVSGELTGAFGKINFKFPVELKACESKTVVLDPSVILSLRLHNPRLWWPNGYGAQNLYRVHLDYRTVEGALSDEKTFLTGIREMAYSDSGGALRIWVNGKRFIARGGNWGFSEDLLRYRSREYDIAVRYHKEMNFTMIRNWVGQTGDDAFYDACDKYGIMVWQDFWLANPLDGPDPNDDSMFISNVADYVKRIRNHPSIGLYVGRNEGNPPPTIDSANSRIVAEFHPGVRYIPNSAFGDVSGGGPYRLMPVKYYFKERATTKLHSEIGMPAIVSYSSLVRMMPVSDVWPQSWMWGLHDFTLEGAQYGNSFNAAIEESFGQVDKLREWLWLADFTEYQGYRAMFEAQSKNRMGVLIWMSHSSWPSLVWQTYDYYFDPTAAYFGCREASEPLHVQWNAFTDSIEVANYSVARGSGLTATMEIVNLDGKVKLKKTARVDCPEDHTVRPFAVVRPAGLTRVYFIKLELKRGGEIVSRNLYWCGTATDSLSGAENLRAVLAVPRIKIDESTRVVKRGDSWKLTVNLANHSKFPALLVRLKVVGDKSGQEILPAFYDDNFITLMPGERRHFSVEVENEDVGGQKPEVVVEGLNIK